MARILNRPMFRRGGSTNEGIMHGLVNRKGYAEGPTQAEVYGKEYLDMLSKVPIPKSRFPMGQVGLNLISGEYAGDGLLQNIGGSAMGPYGEWTKADDATRNLRYQRDIAATKMGISRAEQERLALMKKKADISKIQLIAHEMQRNNPDKYPNTPEGNAAAWNDAFEASETSPGKPKKDSWLDIYRSEKSDPMTEPNVAENRADWTVYIRPNVPPEKRGGAVPTVTIGKGANAVDEVNPDAMDPGKVYWDEQTGTLFEVIQNEDGSKTAREVPNWRQDYFIRD